MAPTTFRMALPPLHNQIAVLTTYLGHVFRALAVAIVLIGLLVVVNRSLGLSPGQTRELLPTYVLTGLLGAVLVAAVTTWRSRRKSSRRHRRSY